MELKLNDKTTTIKHANVTWESYIPKGVKTLVLGSFNPDSESNTDYYYYGRDSNYLWKALADLLQLEQNHFLGDFKKKKLIMDKYSFCFLDLIDKIEIFSNDDLDNFVKEKICKEFSDQVLFTTKTKYNGAQIFVKRYYNKEIIKLLKTHDIKTIIHTLGNNRINTCFETNPRERRLGAEGFQGFINTIRESNPNFIKKSYSPSGRAVKTGGHGYYNDLKIWLKMGLNIG